MPIAYSMHAASVASASQRYLMQHHEDTSASSSGTQYAELKKQILASMRHGASQTEKQETEEERLQQLEKEKQVYSTAIKVSDAPVVKELVKELQGNSVKCFIVTDPTLEGLPIVYASPGFLDMTDYAEDEVLGRNCRFLQGSSTDFLTARRIGDAVSNRKEYTVQILNYKKDGTPFWNLLHLAPVEIQDQSGEQRCFYIGIQTNVSVPKKLQPKGYLKNQNEKSSGSSYVAKHGFTAFLPSSLRPSVSDDTSKVGSTLSKFSTFRQGMQAGVTFTASHVSYSIPTRGEGQPPSLLLDDVSVYAKPGEMLAIMGPSGSGKTTLLNALAGRATNSLDVKSPDYDHSMAKEPALSGSIALNGRPRVKDDKRKIAYVMQDDVLFDNLTVEETLHYGAKLKMPDSTPEEDIRQRVEEVISLLKLEKCRKTVVGSPISRGVSGGERKRVNIGNEIVTDPAVLMLDEPTSGLDSSNALRLLSSLSMLAAAGRTVMTTIHQPSTQIFNCFDKLLLLGEGRVLYFGSTDDVLHYFASPPLKQVCPPHWNPADFLLGKKKQQQHVIVHSCVVLFYGSKSSTEVASHPEMVQKVADHWTKQHKELEDVANICGTTALEPPPVTNQDEETENEDVVLNVEQSGKQMELDNENASTLTRDEKWPTSFWTQFLTLMHRSFKQGRGSTMTGYYLGQTIAMTIVVSLLWWQVDDDADRIADREGVVFFASVYWGFNPLFNSLTTFPAERSVLTRERAGGMYRLSAYFLAKSCADIPLVFTYPTIFAVIAYWAVGLKVSAGAFFTFLCGLYVNGLAAQALGLAVSSWVLDFRKSLVVAVVLMLSFMLAGGFYIQDIPDFMTWYAALGFISYTYPLMMENEFDGRTFECKDGVPRGYNECPVTGEAVIDRLDPFIKNIGGNFGVLLLMAIGFRFIAYWGLRHRTKSNA